MLYTIQAGDTLNSIAEIYTIGGAAYGPAIGANNAISSLANFPAGNTLDIPNNWLKSEYQSNLPNINPQNIPVDIIPKQATIFSGIPGMLIIAGGILALLALFGSTK